MNQFFVFLLQFSWRQNRVLKQNKNKKRIIPQNKNAKVFVRFHEKVPSVNLPKPLVRFHSSFIFVYMIKSRRKKKFCRVCQPYVPRMEMDLPVREIFFLLPIRHRRPLEPVWNSKTIRGRHKVDKNCNSWRCLKKTKKTRIFHEKKRTSEPNFFTLASGLLHLLKTFNIIVQLLEKKRKYHVLCKFAQNF